jgi:AraC family transcriptional regulator
LLKRWPSSPDGPVKQDKAVEGNVRAVAALEDTHGLVTRPGTRVWATSEALGWRSIFASTQREAPFEGKFEPVADHLVVIHLSGPVRVSRTLDGKQEARRIPPGGAFIMPGDTSFGVRLEGELDTLHFYLHRDIVDEIAAELGGTDVQIVPGLGAMDPMLEQIALALREQLRNPGPLGALYVDCLARAAAARLLLAHSTAACKPLPVPGKASLNDRRLRRVVDFIEANLDRDPSLADLAAVSGLSPIYFARHFRRATGLAPHQYLLRARIERAKRLLSLGDLPISGIALDCGFCHQEHLTRAFRKFCGTTPAAYRSAMRA